MTQAAASTKVVTGKCRFSYAQQLYVPKPNDKGIDKFGVTLLIPKSDKVTYDKLCAANEAVLRAKVSGQPEAFYKAKPKTVHDGDGTRPSDGTAYSKECKGHWVVTVASNERPEVVDENANPLMEKINSGDYGRVSLNAYYFTGTNKGVTFGLGNVQLLERGERIDGRTSAADDFSEF